jgi:hypothetical protein
MGRRLQKSRRKPYDSKETHTHQSYEPISVRPRVHGEPQSRGQLGGHERHDQKAGPEGVPCLIPLEVLFPYSSHEWVVNDLNKEYQARHEKRAPEMDHGKGGQFPLRR